MRVLVTGAGGFIGSNLCNLLTKNHQVLALSRTFYNLSKNDNLFCAQYEMSKYEMLEKEFANFSPEIVDYLYIDDFCKGVLQIIENELYGEFIISSDNEYQVRNIVERIYNIIKPNSNLIFDENISEHGFRYICGTSKKLKYKSNWKPEVTLEEGLIRTINYFKTKV